MDEYYSFRNKIVLTVLIVAACVFVALIIIGYNNEAKSFFSGVLIGALNFLLMSQGIASFGKNPEKASSVFFRKSVLRFIILGLLIFYFIHKTLFSLIYFIFGLLLLQIVVIVRFGFLTQEKRK
ncbi:MAG: hypothetical protein ACD_79C00288G0002 [uncultured bacterium]|nr:MAG: hypothetical protein ACD_79C00288G0002 [uncultured bacterium]